MMKQVKAIKQLLNAFMERAAADKHLMPSHLSLVMAVFYFMQNTDDAVQVSRKKLMHFSRIRSISTYHKCIRELEGYGYLEYRPSYHPLLGSEIRIMDKIY